MASPVAHARCGAGEGLPRHPGSSGNSDTLLQNHPRDLKQGPVAGLADALELPLGPGQRMFAGSPFLISVSPLPPAGEGAASFRWGRGNGTETDSQAVLLGPEGLVLEGTPRQSGGSAAQRSSRSHQTISAAALWVVSAPCREVIKDRLGWRAARVWADKKLRVSP